MRLTNIQRYSSNLFVFIILHVHTKESNIKDCLVAPDYPLLIIILYTANLYGGRIQSPDSQVGGTPCKVDVDVA